MSKGLGPYWYDLVLLSKAVLADWPQRSKLPSREPSVERAAWQDTAESLGTRGPSHKELISANTHVGLAEDSKFQEGAEPGRPGGPKPAKLAKLAWTREIRKGHGCRPLGLS